MSDSYQNKEEDRVTVLGQKGQGVRTFRKVSIVYETGELCYRGWIQIFGDGDVRNGPTAFQQNYFEYGLDMEEVFPIARLSESPLCNNQNIEIRNAVTEDLDEIIDLRLQGFSDDVYDRISAYQGLMHKIDPEHLTLVFTVDGAIFGLIYFDLEVNAASGEAYLDNWFCAAGMRSRGVGTALVKSGLEKVRELGFRSVSARIIGSENHCQRNASILQKCGFTVDECFEYVPGIINVNLSMEL